MAVSQSPVLTQPVAVWLPPQSAAAEMRSRKEDEVGVEGEGCGGSNAEREGGRGRRDKAQPRKQERTENRSVDRDTRGGRRPHRGYKGRENILPRLGAWGMGRIG